MNIIERTATGFKVYGPFASVLVADKNKVVTYSNLVEDAPAYKSMLGTLMAYKD